MNGSGFLERLMDGASVEWRPLGEVIKILRGKRLTKTELSSDGKYPVFHGGLDPLGYYGQSNRPANSVMIINVGASAGTVGYSDRDFWSSDGCFCLSQTDQVNSKFLYHFLVGHERQIKGKVRVAGIPTLDAIIVKKILIPVPCPNDRKKSLAIQAEIVRILDSFTEINAEINAKINAEINARKKQYKHYRDRLLGFEGCDVDWKTLNEIGEFIRGKRFTKADYVDEGIGAIHYGEIYTHYGVYAHETLSEVKSEMADALRFAEPNDVVIAGVSETIEDVGKAVAWLGDGKVAIHDDSYAFRHKMNPKFIAYAMQTNAFHDQKAKHVSSGKIKRLLIDGIKKVRLPVPYPDDPKRSLDEQARVVAILDKFDMLTTSLSESLPREMELRQKQYEYYRAQLLSLPKTKGSA
ncbi:restriction endonuclease subunit S [Rhizobium laguerreae]